MHKLVSFLSIFLFSPGNFFSSTLKGNMKDSTSKTILILSIIVFAAFARLLPFLPNFAPITALAIFGAMTFSNKRLALILPLLAMLLSDLLLASVKSDWGYAFHDTTVAVYLCFIAVVGIGLFASRKKNYTSVVLATLGGSVLFFVVTNFAVWSLGTMYAHTVEGLVTCYAMAIPFFRNSLIGDFSYVALMFGAYEISQRFALRRV